MLGSPLYMSPEQARGSSDVDARADLWSLGVVLYQVLSGRTPHQDIEDGVGNLIVAICTNAPAPIHHVAPWVPSPVAAIVHKALALRRESRFQSAREMRGAIEPLLGGSDSIDDAMLVPLSDAEKSSIAPAVVEPYDATAVGPLSNRGGGLQRQPDVRSIAVTVPVGHARAKAAEAPVGKAPARILIVEDNEMNMDMLSRRLVRKGYVVLAAVDGESGVAMARAEKPDLVLMDVSLPGMDGWAATQALRAAAETASPPIIALTAHARSDDPVTDDGGSCGRLIKDFDILPPGDIRNCLSALSEGGALSFDLFQYRFDKGQGLSGHSLGNLLLAALTHLRGNFLEAVQCCGDIMNVKGRILPCTSEKVSLGARFRDGLVIKGETFIAGHRGRIENVFLIPSNPAPLPQTIGAIEKADAIIIGPGSLYTSIIPSLLAEGMPEAIRRSRARKIYICNQMTEPGETDG